MMAEVPYSDALGIEVAGLRLFLERPMSLWLLELFHMQDSNLNSLEL